MILSCTPYSLTKNLGQEMNAVMERMREDDWVIFTDHDAIYTTANWGKQIAEAIEKYPQGTFCAVTNRIGNKEQVISVAPEGDDYNEHRMVGDWLDTHARDLMDDVTFGTHDLLGGVCIVISKKTWEKIGGFKEGILGVDNDIHLKLREHGLKLYRIHALYLYHWYRNGNRFDKSHLQ